MSFQDFRSRFHYLPEFAGRIGIEREGFIIAKSGFGSQAPQPVAEKVLNLWKMKGVPLRVAGVSCFGPDSLEWSPAQEDEFGYELSACQIESRIGPVELEHLRSELWNSRVRLRDLLEYMKYRVDYSAEVGPASMSLEVYPDPSGRYQAITRTMPREVLLAACRVIGTHVHVGMPDHKTALKVYNSVIRNVGELCEIGNGSFGERLAIYRQMAPDYHPEPYDSWRHFYRVATERGFDSDPRKCWTFIRISVHGTIEFRMFGATEDEMRIVSWATRCHELCLDAMK